MEHFQCKKIVNLEKSREPESEMQNGASREPPEYELQREQSKPQGHKNIATVVLLSRAHPKHDLNIEPFDL